MSFDYIRKYYGVPAEFRGEVAVLWHSHDAFDETTPMEDFQ